MGSFYNPLPQLDDSVGISGNNPNSTSFPFDDPPNFGEYVGMGAVDVTTFVAVFLGTMGITIAVTYVTNLCRERWAAQRRVETGESCFPENLPPESYLVSLIIDKSDNTEKEVDLATAHGPCLEKVDSSVEVDVIESTYSAPRNGLDLSRSHSESTASHRQSQPPAGLFSSPLSIEPLPSLRPSDPPLISLHYLLLFPNSSASLRAGQIPDFAIATAVGIDESREREDVDVCRQVYRIPSIAFGDDWQFSEWFGLSGSDRSRASSRTSPEPSEMIQMSSIENV
ncbi:hypothetical protein BJ742DRAFT_376412 [Cladochytrium replicatum]|nr:hypothetical protein BJ742DRAFT_376412 [Cladochytrium replicatum]